MSKIIPRKCQCFVCGNESEQYLLLSSNSFFGSPDLDLRPAPMMRNTMDAWLQECPECGYVSEHLTDKTTVDREWLKKYRGKSVDFDFYSEKLNVTFSSPIKRGLPVKGKRCVCGEITFKASLAVRFYKRYLICLADGDHMGAFFAALHTAWICDDTCDDDNAKDFRLKALEELEKCEIDSDDAETFALRKADIMRRSEKFDEVITQFEGMTFSDGKKAKIIAFQVELAKNKESGQYKIEQVLKNE